jgi:hypothetical protein
MLPYISIAPSRLHRRYRFAYVLIFVTEKLLAFFRCIDSDERMIQGGFLTKEERDKLTALAHDDSLVWSVARGANALVLLDDGKTYQQVADVFLLDADTICGWHELFKERGIEALASFNIGESGGRA